jgi:ABC-2 type transport system permease protein
MTNIVLPSTAITGPPTGYRPANFTDAVRAEWTKIRTVRSTLWTLLVAVVLAVGLGALISALAANGYAQGRGNIRTSWDPTGVSMSGLTFAQLAIAVLAIIFITSEYSSRAIGTSLTAVPRRSRFLAAKAVVIGGICLVFTEILSFVAFFVGQALISGHAPTANLSQPNVLRAMIGGGLYAVLLGLISLSLGAMLRNAAGAIAVIVALLFVLPVVAAALPSSIEHTVEEWWPTQAGGQVTNVIRGSHTLSPWEGFAVMCAFTAILLAGAFAAINRRDA